MKIVSKQVLGYFLISLLVGTLSILGTYLINRNIAEIVEVENPKVVASLEIEINTNKLLDAFHAYNINMSHRALTRFDDSVRDYEHFRDNYRERIVTDGETLLMQELDKKAQQMIQVCKDTIKLRQDMEVSHNKIWDYVEVINRIVDDKIQPGIHKTTPYSFEKISSSNRIEVNVHKIFFALESYLVKPNKRMIIKFEDSKGDYQRHKKQFLSLPLSSKTRQLIKTIDHTYNRGIEEAQHLMAMRDRQDKYTKEALDIYQEIDDLLDYRIQPISQERIKAIEERVLNSTILLIISVFLVVIISIVAGYLISRRMSKLLIRLRDATKRVGSGNFDMPVKIILSNDEIGELGVAFNNMLLNIKETSVSRDFLDNIIRNISDIILVADVSGHIRISNPAASSILEYDHETLPHKKITDILIMEGKMVDINKLENIIINRSIAYHDITFRTESGIDIPVNCSASIIRNKKEELELIVIVARDMRAILHMMEDKAKLAIEKKRFKELVKLNKALRENEQKLVEEKKKAEAASKAKSSFLATMSHELRTPMNSIIGYTRLVLQNGKGELSERMHSNLERVDISSKHLLNVINDILDLSKIESGELIIEDAPFSLLLITSDVVSTIKGKISSKKRITINFKVDKDIPEPIFGDSGHLMQIMLNLVDNAIKFTTEGVVSLNISLESQEQNSINIRFEVKDTGVGVPKDKLDIIFKPFTQADMSTTRKYGGSGLGLSICKSLVEGMHGNIWVESEEGIGSKFIFVLPFRIDNAEDDSEEGQENV